MKKLDHLRYIIWYLQMRSCQFSDMAWVMQARKEEEAQSYSTVESHNITEILMVSIKVGKAIDSVSHQFLHGGQALARLGKTLDQFDMLQVGSSSQIVCCSHLLLPIYNRNTKGIDKQYAINSCR